MRVAPTDPSVNLAETPARMITAEVPPDLTGAPPACDMPRVLVLDDNAAFAHMAASLLRALGCAAVVTTGPWQFLDTLRRMRPSHVLVDFDMPEMNGFAVLDRLAAEGATARVLVTSGHERQCLASLFRHGCALGLDMAGMLSKPFRQADLQELVLGRPATAAPHAGAEAMAGPANPALQAQMRLPRLELAGFCVAQVAIPPITPQDSDTAARAIDLVLPAAASWGRRVAMPLPDGALALPGLPEWLAKRAQVSGLSPARLTLHIRATDILPPPSPHRAALEALRAAGYALALDEGDLDTNVLDALVHLPFGELRLPADILQASRVEGRRKAETLCALAVGLGLNVTARNIASNGDLERAVNLGCTLGEGPLFASPVLRQPPRQSPQHSP